MTILSILESLLIGPLKLVFEIVFETAYRIVGHPGLAIIFLSLIMNILVLPLYRRADAMQEEARDKEEQLRAGVTHIKKVFSGDERMMILQIYYRQNHYKPTDSLNGSVSLLLQIPFFMAAYQFLSHLEVLKGVSFGPIADLAAPDGLLVIGGAAINLLPILMTLINVVSGTLYSQGFPLKTKIQLYGIALVFLVLLYTSPAGLVFYWTLNNVFSLIKNIFNKLSLSKMKNVLHIPKKESVPQPDGRMFLLGALFLTVLLGLLIPSAFIGDSPQEYVDITYFHNPLWYIVNCLCMAAGTFLIWMSVFYWLASPKGKVIFDRFIWILCGVTIIDYMYFGTDLGIISSTLQYENDISFSPGQQMVNLLVLLVVSVILSCFSRKWKCVITSILIVTLSVMSVLYFRIIHTAVDGIDIEEAQLEEDSEIPCFQLSRTGQNVIVFMLDRAMGEYVPYLFQENPKLEEQFAGFTYYKNTISFGPNTNFCTPALFGGYEYTPVEMNRRAMETLVSKHNEALKVMPVIFSESGYDVTVCDPPYANYQWIPDLSIYDDCPGVTAYITEGRFDDTEGKQAIIDQNYRNFFCFSVMKTMPLFLQSAIYDHGRYHQVTADFSENSDDKILSIKYSPQWTNGISSATGVDAEFMAAYYVLVNLPDMTEVTEDGTDTFLVMANSITHSPMLLQEPDYTPSREVDNTVYDAENGDRFVVEGRELKMEQSRQMAHYHANMAAMIQLGNWFDYLRENNVYDNTRIILASDHAYALAQLEEFVMDDGSDRLNDLELYFPLLMVKDFNSKEFVTSDTFMTNADVPALAMEDIIPNPINPFTGKAINSDEKTAHEQFIIMSEDWQVDANDEYTFLPARWASIKDNIWSRDNWTFYDERTVLDEYTAP